MGVEALMRYAWLEFHRGVWLLLTDDKNEPAEAARRWRDRETALSELAAEVWTSRGPYPKTPDARVKSWGVFQGYVLKRLVH